MTGAAIKAQGVKAVGKHHSRGRKERGGWRGRDQKAHIHIMSTVRPSLLMFDDDRNPHTWERQGRNCQYIGILAKKIKNLKRTASNSIKSPMPLDEVGYSPWCLDSVGAGYQHRGAKK